jgi:thiamine-monophosphate kinase
MDLSDGLVKDLERMLRGSGVGGRLRVGDVPFSEAARKVLAREPERLAQLLTGGDDYEVLAAVAGPPAWREDLRGGATVAGVPLTEIGFAGLSTWPETGDGLLIEAPDGRPLAVNRTGWDHF